ncbi:Hypothetical protein BHO_0024500 (plasmid) [Borrelia hermsii YBT]|uniref:hypothetical protein n=1 Tax=Borrelia hermsii TaxID=140 RepID=UPI0003E3ABF9|nr:hypothetical protein [Borrelia hermsii]AHH13010.1 Hypothetical protein BHO_0024500 [Borrelia hermsii YBT]
MKKVSMVLCVLVMLACEQDEPNGSGFGTTDSRDLEKNIGPCDQRVVLKPTKIDSRHVAFYKLYKMVKKYKEFFNSRTFKNLGSRGKPIFGFPIAQIFPVYNNADFIYEGLDYNIRAIKSLEFIFHTLNLNINSINLDLMYASQLLEYLLDSARLLKTLLNENFSDATLERLKATKTAEELTKIYFYLEEVVEDRNRFISKLSDSLVRIAVNNFDRASVLEILANNIIVQNDGLRHGNSIGSRISNRGDIIVFYASMRLMVDVVLCFIKN